MTNLSILINNKIKKYDLMMDRNVLILYKVKYKPKKYQRINNL